MRLYLIRHADPDYVHDTITPRGLLEAQALAKWFAREEMDHVYCSPMGRAVDTMNAAIRGMGVQPAIVPWMAELYHWVEVEPWGKLHVCDVPGEFVRNQEEAAAGSEGFNRAPYNDGELVRKVHEIKTAADSLIQQHGYERVGQRYRILKGNREKIAVFCHGALSMTLLSHLLGIPAELMWCGFWPAPSSVTTVLFEERSEHWAVPRCIGFGNTSHLFEANLPISDRGIIGNFY